MIRAMATGRKDEMTTRVLAPASTGTSGMTSITVGGVRYTFKDGDIKDLDDAIAALLGSSGAIAVSTVDSTIGSRPKNPSAGSQHLDTSINQMLVFDGSSWRNPLSGARQ
jgi:hypothetical protein